MHPRVDVLSTIDFAGILDFTIGSLGFFYKGAYLFLICRVSLDGFHNQAMGRTAGLLCQGTKPRTELRG
jgi:hypothetical protein